MRDPYILLNKGEFQLTAQGETARFRKELIGEATLQHPTRPWADPLVVDKPYLDGLADRTNAAMGAGIKTPFPMGHNDGEDAAKNRGFVVPGTVTVELKENGKYAAFGEIEVTNPEIVDQIGKDLRDVSVYIDDFGSGDFDPGGDRIVHVALTNYPVYADQENFVALSSCGRVSSIPVLREVVAVDERTTMKLSQTQRDAAKALGVTFAGDELDAEGLDALLSAATPDPVEPAPEVTADDVPRLLSVDAGSNPYFVEYRKQLSASVEADVEAMEKAGKLTTEMAEAAKTLLSVGNSYALSNDGSAEAVDTADLVRKLLSGIPDKAVINITEDPDLEAGVGVKPPVEADAFSAEKVQELSARILKS